MRRPWRAHTRRPQGVKREVRSRSLIFSGKAQGLEEKTLSGLRWLFVVPVLFFFFFRTEVGSQTVSPLGKTGVGAGWGTGQRPGSGSPVLNRGPGTVLGLRAGL